MVVTDGSRVLGMGDLGIGGLGISIGQHLYDSKNTSQVRQDLIDPLGKLDLYVAAGGFHPKRVLPAVLDIGTANKALLEDPKYLGRKEPRLEGEEYYRFIGDITLLLHTLALLIFLILFHFL